MCFLVSTETKPVIKLCNQFLVDFLLATVGCRTPRLSDCPPVC